MYCIAYAPGCYGKFVGWTLEWMQDKYPVDYRPFNTNHNSHNWKKPERKSVQLAIDYPVNGCLLHPKHKQEDTIDQTFNELFTVYDKIVTLYSGPNNTAWVLNNKQTKIWKDWWINNIQAYFFSLPSWENKEIWELREFCSIHLFTYALEDCGYEELINIQQKNVLPIQINQLRDNFIETIDNLCDWLEIPVVRTREDLTILHKDWVQNEPFLYKDMLIDSFVSAIIKNENLSMKHSSLIDQAEIQRRLRNAGYEIKCYGLNEWPNTTTQLRELIYEAE